MDVPSDRESVLPNGKLTGVPFRRKRGYRTGIESIRHIATYKPNGRKSLVRHPGPAQCFFNRAKQLKQSPKIPDGMAEGDPTVSENGGYFRFGAPSESGSRPRGEGVLQAARIAELSVVCYFIEKRFDSGAPSAWE